MICDFHVHTGLSYDSNADINEVILSAAKKNMEYLAITDHHDFSIEFGAFEQDPIQYYNTINAYRNRYKKDITVAVGIELGIEACHSEKLYDFVSKCDFDFVIGSIHGVNGLDPYYDNYWEGKTTAEGMNKYFNALLDSLEKFDNFDVVGHIDYAIRYARKPEEKNYSYDEYGEILDKILKKIIQMGKGIEINTGGLRKGLTTSNPSESIIKRYYELGGRIITVGSDAHTPTDIGADFDIAKEILMRCGFTGYYVFLKRKPVFISF